MEGRSQNRFRRLAKPHDPQRTKYIAQNHTLWKTYMYLK